MKNITELRNRLAAIFDGLESGKVTPSEAAEFSNLAGKIIISAKVELEYYALRKETPMIEFLEPNNRPLVVAVQTKAVEDQSEKGEEQTETVARLGSDAT